jgi:hypothetical protein
MKTIFAAFLLLLAAPDLASADELAFEIGPWQGHRLDHDGVFSHCAALNLPREDEALILAIGRDGQLAVAARSGDWKFKEGATLMATVTVDGVLIANQVQATGKRAIRFVYTDAEEATQVYDAIAAGHAITIRTPSGAVTFSLADAPQVLEALIGCAQKAIAQETGDDPDVGNIYQDSQAVRVERSEAMVFVVNMLAAAGLTGQVYLQPSEYRDVLPDYDVVWRNPDGTLGAATLFSHAAKGDLDTAASNILGSETARCKGNFISGVRKSEDTDSATTKELFTTCEAEGGARETYYVIYVTDDGLLLATGTIALTAGQEQTVEETGAAIARGLHGLSF